MLFIIAHYFNFRGLQSRFTVYALVYNLIFSHFDLERATPSSLCLRDLFIGQGKNGKSRSRMIKRWLLSTRDYTAGPGSPIYSIQLICLVQIWLSDVWWRTKLLHILGDNSTDRRQKLGKHNYPQNFPTKVCR